MIQTIRERISQSSSFIKSELNGIYPELAIVLGSGFANWVNAQSLRLSLPYGEIPGYLTTEVIGHPGKLHLATIDGANILIMQGRSHHYEGYHMMELSIPVRVLQKLGVKNLIITNAAGGINTTYAPGHLMLIKDHINLGQLNPLIGPNLDEFGTRFPDAGNIYDHDWRAHVKKLSKATDLTVHEGVYIYNRGPSFETPAEIRMMSLLGADAVGMSTVPEALTANHAGIRTLGISLITNYAAGIADEPLSHHDVVNTMAKVEDQVYAFINTVIKESGNSIF